MKDATVSRRKRMSKLKILVSFNGAFCRRPPSRKLRYTGGETRIISVERNVTFSLLKSKIITDLLRPNGTVSGPGFSLKYHISESFCGVDWKDEGEGPVLIQLESDDDVRCMVEEYDRLELLGKFLTRLWVFVCDDKNISSDCNIHENLNMKSDGFYEGRKGLAGIQGNQNNLREDEGFVSDDFWALLGKGSDNKTTNHKTKKCNDDSLRKTVLRQQLLTRKLDEIRIFRAIDEPGEIEFNVENGDCEAPMIELCSEPESLPSFPSKKMNFWGDLDGEVTDYKFVHPHRLSPEKGFGKVLPMAQSVSHLLNSEDGNLYRGSGGSLRPSHKIFGGESTCIEFVAASGEPSKLSHYSGLSSKGNGLAVNFDFGRVDGALLIYGNGKNIMPRGGGSGDNFVKCNEFSLECETRQDGCQFGIRKPRLSSSEARNCPYHSKDQALFSEMGYNGRPWIGKICPRKPVTNFHCHKGEDVDRRMDWVLNARRFLKHERVNPGECHRASFGACATEDDKSPMLFDSAANSLPQKDLLTGPFSVELQVGETLNEAINGESPLDIIRGQNLRNQEDVINSPQPNNLSYRDRAELSCNHKYLDAESGCDQYNKASSVDPFVHNLALETSCKLHLPASSCAMIDSSESMLTPQSNELDLIDEELSYSGPKVEKSSDVSSVSFSENDAKLAKDDDEKQKIQQDVEANLCTQEKVKNKMTNKWLKANDRLPADVTACFTHLASRELQDIRNSDLECIKELGSGTFGTVYYGKWKGSDVAIKRIKLSCFTNGAKDEDRLIADFWKEAHILGQLRHPNIVAFYGVATDGPVNSLATVTEYMANGSLKQVLRKKDRTIDRRKRLIIAMDATCGMEYLHEKNIVHFDLKSHNFLMNTRDPHRPVCKIGDLGLSKIKERTLVSGGVRGTLPWMAPELLSGNSMVSEKVDVYSFGIVLWELLTGEEPYENMRSEEMIAGIIRGDLRPEIPCWCDPAWRSLIEMCWSSNPDCRPPFSEIAKELRAMAASMNIK